MASALADAAMAGKPVPSDFALRWQNDFVKAQRGTFVPFTLTADASRLTRQAALVYVRAIRRLLPSDRRRQDRERPADRDEAAYPVDAFLQRTSASRTDAIRGFLRPVKRRLCHARARGPGRRGRGRLPCWAAAERSDSNAELTTRR
jgi:hypothetical protein